MLPNTKTGCLVQIEWPIFKWKSEIQGQYKDCFSTDYGNLPIHLAIAMLAKVCSLADQTRTLAGVYFLVLGLIFGTYYLNNCNAVIH